MQLMHAFRQLSALAVLLSCASENELLCNTAGHTCPAVMGWTGDLLLLLLLLLLMLQEHFLQQHKKSFPLLQELQTATERRLYQELQNAKALTQEQVHDCSCTSEQCCDLMNISQW